MLFTTKQISSILENVDFYHNLYILENVGKEVLSKSDKAILIKRGIDPSKYSSDIDPVSLSYGFGKIESTIRDPKSLHKLNLDKYKDFYKKNPELFKFNKEDKVNLRALKQQLYKDIKKAASDIKADLHQNLIDTSKTTQNIKDPKIRSKIALKSISKGLAENTKKYSNRFTMISSYNMHSAYQNGIAAELLQRKGNTKVYFSVHPDACDICVKLYLRKGRGSEPKVFYLQNIINNGNNRGRKRKDMLPSLDPVHPHCRCKLNFYPGIKAIWSPRQNKYIRRFK